MRRRTWLVGPRADLFLRRTVRRHREQLRRELASYRTPAERADLLATFDRYPDEVTRDLRDAVAFPPQPAPRWRAMAPPTLRR